MISNDEGTREDDAMEDFCSACIDKAIKARQKELPNTTFSYEWTRGYESDRFIFCETCGDMIEIALLLDSQELEFWESCDDEYYKKLSPIDAWQLSKVIDEGESSKKFGERIEKLANRILNALDA